MKLRYRLLQAIFVIALLCGACKPTPLPTASVSQPTIAFPTPTEARAELPLTQGNEAFPPGLTIGAQAPDYASPGEVFTVTLTVFNQSAAAVTGLTIQAEVAGGAGRITAALDGGMLDGDVVRWQAAELAGGGASLSVRYRVEAAGGAGEAVRQVYSAATDGGEPVYGPVQVTFLGSSVPTWAVQGGGNASPYSQDFLTTEGIVTGVFPGLRGFWLQAPAADADPATSDGLFIDTVGFDIGVQPGDWVQVTGLVRELYQQTSLTIGDSEDVELLSQANPLPPAVELDPPAGAAQAQAYYEALEGMLVQVSGPARAVAPTSVYGETVVVLAKHNVTRLWQGQENGIAIMLDDGSAKVHTERTTLAAVVKTGDELRGLRGPLAYTFGRYKIEPVTQPVIHPVEAVPPSSLAPAGPAEFSLMTWNVENLFDARQPHPADPALPTRAEYQLALEKVANTIVAAGAPALVGLQEVENLAVLTDLAARAGLAPYAYQPVLVEGFDSRGIDVGYLVRGDYAEILDVQQRPAPEGLTSRPPLLIRLALQTEGGALALTVINNHFTSMGGGAAATEGQRLAQAAWNVTLLEELRAADPQAQVVVMGDLNAYYQSAPVDRLRAAGLRHVFEALPAEACYTYIYQGESQALDHILVTAGLLDQLSRVEVLHVNADFPPPLPGDTSPERQSDHDPVVAVFRLAP